MNELIEPLRLAAAGFGRSLRAMMADVVLCAVIGLCVLVAIGFGLNAAHVALRPMVGPAWASGIIAGGLLFVALVIALIRNQRRSRLPVVVARVPLKVPVAPVAVATPTLKPQTADPLLSTAFVAGFLCSRWLLKR